MPEIKVSKGARELAGKLTAIAGQLCAPGNRRKFFAEEIQSALRELLEKAELFRAQNYNRIGASDFAAALEPWQPK